MACSSLLLAAIFCSVPVFAHDMWIELADFSPELGDTVGVKLRVGQDLLGDPIPRDPSLIRQFFVEDSEGRKPLVGRNGVDPAGFLRVTASGLHVLGYLSNPSPVELPAEKFNQYLKDEGLSRIPASQGKVRERFTRCAKSLVLAGPGSASDLKLGFPLELIAEQSPYALRGQDLPIRLTYEDKPLAGALVVAFNRKNPAQKLTARTDQEGRVRLRIHGDGLWLIKAVHMIPSTTPDADWFSYWASLTFQLAPGQFERGK